MTTDPRLRELADRHHKVKGHSVGGPKGYCWADGHAWPCDTSIVLTELDTLERRAGAAEAVLDDLRNAVAQEHGVGTDNRDYIGPGHGDLPRAFARANTLLKARSLISGIKEPTDG